MPYNPSSLFNQPGYVPLKDYLKDIRHMEQHGPWKLPLRGWRDRFQVGVLSFVNRYSWFRGGLFILNPFQWSPAYSIILTTLFQKHFFDTLRERQIPNRRLYSYLFTRNMAEKGKPKTEIFSQGTAQDRATALSKAIGEIIERCVAGYFNEDKTILHISSATLLSENIPIIYPPRFHRFLSIQVEKHPFLRHNSNEEVEWIAGKNLITGKETYIPRRIVMWGSNRYIGEGLMQHSTSNGSAGYFTKEGAILRGLLEVVHRDAFLVHWLTRTAPNRIRPETLSEDLRLLLSELKSRGISIYLLDVTDIPIPSIVAVAVNEQAKIPQIVISGAAAVAYKEAIQHAIEEMAVVSWRLEKDSDHGSSSKIDPEPFVSQLDQYGRLHYWRGRDRLRQFQWFLLGPLVDFPDICKKDLIQEMDDHVQLKRCLGVLKSLGSDFSPVVYYPQHHLLKQLGYVVAQVFIPKAFPFYMEEHLGTFDSDRLDEFARSRGKIKWTLNPDPHMFS